MVVFAGETSRFPQTPSTGPASPDSSLREWARLESNQPPLPSMSMEAGPGRSRASVHLPRGRSTQLREPVPPSRPHVTFSRTRTLFSEPLAYPSTLDRRPPVAHIRSGSSSYVEELWSPSLARRVETRRQKHTLIASAIPSASAPRVFLSQAGPRFDLGLVQAEHHLWFRR